MTDQLMLMHQKTQQILYIDMVKLTDVLSAYEVSIELGYNVLKKKLRLE